MWQPDLHPAYEIDTPPADAVLTADDLHEQCRVDSTDEDPLIEAYIAAATELVERDARLYLRPAILILHLDAWPQCGPVRIERCPVSALTAVNYTDPDGESQVWDADEYNFDGFSRPARLEPAFGFYWPVVRRQANAIQIEFECGHAEGEAPETALQMIRLLVGHWFEHREAAGKVTQEIAFSYGALLERLAW
jgi:uncharacterized phiE125 gp8 family phage protein